jgi:hypothetical protein
MKRRLRMALFNVIFWAFTMLAGPGFDRYAPPDPGFAGGPAIVGHSVHHSGGLARPMDTDPGGPS